MSRPASATYRTILPDGVSQDVADTRFNERLYARSAQSNMPEHFVPTKDDKKQPNEARTGQSQATTLDHRPLIIGLLIIIVVLVIVITVQIMRTRAAESATQKPAVAAPPPTPSGPIPSANMQQYEPSQQPRSAAVGERIVSHVMHKKRNGPMGCPIGQTLGRQTVDDKKMLATIAEEPEPSIDSIDEEMRENIARGLQAQANSEEVPMEPGTGLIVGADAAARAELATAPIPVHDDVLIPSTVAQTEESAGVDLDEAIVCPAVLQSGPRSGQICGRRCANGQPLCPNHGKSKK